MTTRARYADVIVDPTGVPMAGATVDVYDTGTTSHIAGTIHDAAVAGSSLPNPIVANAQGEVEFWLDTPIRVDLKYSRPGYVPETHTVEVLAAAPPASTVVVTPTGAIASTDVQSALAELDTEKSATSHGHSGTYVSLFDVTHYGAIGNGIADDSAAIALAVAAASAAGGGTVWVPQGTFLCNTAQGSAPSTRSLLYFNGSAYDEVNFEGVGANSILKTTHATAGILELRGSARNKISNLAFLGAAVGGVLGSNRNSDADISGAGIRLTNCAHATVESNYLSQFGYSAIYLTGGTSFSTVRDNHVYDCTVATWANGINEDSLVGTAGGGTTAPKGNVIAGNRLSNVLGSGGIVVDNTGLASYTQVVDNVVDGNTGFQGIRLLNPVNVTVSGNTVRASKDVGIYCFSSTAMSAVQIVDNMVEACGVTSSVQGIAVTSTGGSLPRDVTVSGNVVRGSGAQGIYVQDITDVLVSDNIVQGSGTKSIHLFYDAARQGFQVIDNIVADGTNEGIHIQAVGAVLSFGRVAGNSVRHNDLAGIRFSPSAPANIVDVVVSGNLVESNDEASAGTTDGITIDGTRVFIVDNIVDGAGTHHRYGLVIAATAVATEVGQNVLTGNLTANYLDSSGTANGPPVMLTGAQTVAGVKTFSSAPVVPAASFPESAITSLVTDLANKAQIGGPTILPTGALAQTFDRIASGGDVAPLSSGRLQLVGIMLPAGLTITSITFCTKTTAAVAPTNQWFALFNNAASPVLLRQTVDDTTTAWAATTAKTLALSSQFVTTYSGLHYLGVMVAAGTPPSFHGINVGTTYVAQIAPVVAGTSTTGLTTPGSFSSPALAPTGVTSVPYAYVS